MKDKAIQGLSEANTKNKLANDAEVAKRNKENVGRRNDYSKSLSSSTVSTSSKSPFLNTQKTNISSSSTKSENDKEAKKRLQQKRQQQALKIAEKLPVINKYAKMAKLAQATGAKQGKQGAFFGKKPGMFNMFGFGNKTDKKSTQQDDVTQQETEDENNGLFSVTISQATLRKVGIGVALGGFICLVFFCIILVSSITDGGGESYLASRDNPTEEELGEAYMADEESEGNDSDSSENNSSTDNDYSDDNDTESSANNNSNSDNIVYVGDSRVVGMCSSVSLSSKEDCSIAKGSMGYSWFSSTALPSIKSKLNTNKKSSIVIYMGTNDLLNSNAPANYAKDYNQLAKDYKDSTIIVVSVTEIDDSKAASNGYQVKNSQVVTFNQSLKSALSSDVKYCDVYSKIKNNFSTFDGIHYTSDTYKNIYQQIKNCL